ncbi:hypothetical protein HHK36_024722 [Tetracentron sinense]|uniref:Uncharacterized protein n=1 Tax=Tetracentron sinense TaxID=13715 RepID=A0A834YLF1_TETSI|nr:hypothetical protein HHK36_024722 [Tetracentron sinense]
MADVVAEISETIEGGEKTVMEDMDLVTVEPIQNPSVFEENQPNGGEKPEVNCDESCTKTSNGDSKRSREDGGESEGENGISKKLKVEKSVEEERLEKLGAEEGEEVEEGQEKKPDPVSLGPKHFSTSVEMFDYFYKFLHYWPPNLNVNKVMPFAHVSSLDFLNQCRIFMHMKLVLVLLYIQYEYMSLLDLLKKGHAEPDKKVGGGVHSFQVRYHPTWKSRCFFLIRHDESVDDFSFRKCVDHILPLPDNMKVKSDVNKVFGGNRGGGGGRGGRGGGGRRGWHGRGRGGRSRN